MLRLVRTYCAIAALAVPGIFSQTPQGKSVWFKSLETSFDGTRECEIKKEAIKIEGISVNTSCSRNSIPPPVESIECPMLADPVSLNFVLDGSDSVSNADWLNMLSFVHHVVTDTFLSQSIEAKQSKIFVAIEQFSSFTRVEWADYYSEDNKVKFKSMLK